MLESGKLKVYWHSLTHPQDGFRRTRDDRLYVDMLMR